MQKHLDVSLKTSYRTLNAFTKETKRVWLVFHGYGQLTEFFIRKFEILDAKENFVIAPQGLSKFYLNGFQGRVGATWMTKEDRLVEIENQQRYIREVFTYETKGLDMPELILFGFSQGVATLCRFAAYNTIKFDQLVFWAGKFPHDLNPDDITHWPENYRLTFFAGDQDQFLNENLIQEERKRLEGLLGKSPTLYTFEGEHEVKPELLLKI